MKLKSITLSWIALLAVTVAPGSIAATLFTGLYSFGDSLSDAGNTSLATGGAAPGPGYYNGRYSNGPVWVELLATRLGLPATSQSLAGGKDYAWAGAYTTTGGSVPTLQQQANQFIGGGGSFLPTDLVTVWGGANDFLLGGQTDPTIPAANIATVIATLAGAGAKNILLLNLPDLGYTPELLATGSPAAIGGFSMLSQGFNATLAASVPSLEANLGIDIHLLDVFGIGTELRTHPGDYGFTNTTLGALPSGNAANAAEFLYWDTVHPTARVHGIFADQAFALVPEPSSVMILWVFGTGLMIRRNRLNRA